MSNKGELSKIILRKKRVTSCNYCISNLVWPSRIHFILIPHLECAELFTQKQTFTILRERFSHQLQKPFTYFYCNKLMALIEDTGKFCNEGGIVFRISILHLLNNRFLKNKSHCKWNFSDKSLDMFFFHKFVRKHFHLFLEMFINNRPFLKNFPGKFT